MSFGFGVGDFLAIIQLANDLRGRFAQAPTEYKAIAEEVESLILALHHIDDLDETEFDSKQRDDLNKVIQSCQDVLRDLEAKLNKMHILANDSTPDWKGRVYKTWRRVRWDQDEVNNSRSRIVSNISLLNLMVGNANKQGIQNLHQRHEDQERDTILSWLSLSSPSARQSEVFNSHQKGTGTWLLQTEQFQQWIGGQAQVLFCPGIPGSGKTVISSIVIDHLEQMFPDQEEVGIAYLFCDFRQHHTPVELYSALLRQAVQRKHSIPKTVKSFYKAFWTKATQPSEADVLCELKSVLTSCTRAFVVIDALDECLITDGSRSIRRPFLRELVRLQSEVGFSLLATSRPDMEIAAHFEQGVSVEIQASKEDIQYYVDVRMDDLPSFVRKRPRLQQCIKDCITEAAKDMFLLARLYFNLLLAEANEKGIRRMLAHFRTASQSNAYDDAYRETMSRVERQGANASDLAKKTIGWIVNAKENLTVAELEHALAVEIGSPEFDEANITDIEQLTAYCCGLVIVDEQMSQVKLVHYTTQKYFQSTWKTWFPDIHGFITDSCVTYISYEVFEEDRFAAGEEVDKIPDEYPFYNYSSLNWGHHFREWPGDQSMALKFLQSEAKVAGYNRCGFEPLGWVHNLNMTGLKAEHIAAWFNLEQLIQKLLEANPDNFDIQASGGGTPLLIAATCGHEAMAKLLLAKGSKPNPPLQKAAERGHEKIVRLLLDQGADIEHGASDGNSPLHNAADNGHDTVVTLLLDRGANVNPKADPDNTSSTALHAAALAGHLTTVKLLLNRGASLESRRTGGAHPLHDASLNGNLEVVKLFLDKGVSPDIANIEGETPLHMVMMNLFYKLVNHENKLVNLERFDATFEFLLKSGANTESRDKSGQTPLHHAVRNCYSILTKLLLAYGANVEARNNNNDTPLYLAAEANSEKTFRMVLDHGASVDVLNDMRETPLHPAARGGNKALVVLLLDRNAKINIGNRSGYTPLFLAAWEGHEVVVRLLLHRGANPNPLGSGPKQLPAAVATHGHSGVFKDELEKGGNPDHLNINGRTPLHMASARGHIAVAKLLLKAGAKPDTQDRYGRTPLFNAICGGHFAMAQLLLSLFDVEKCRADIWGITPAVEAEKRGLHELSSLLCGASGGLESNAETPSDNSDTSRFCDVCLVPFLGGEECYGCENFDICKFCPPVEKSSCPVCGDQLVRKINSPPQALSEDQGCVCM
ncbi:ankyrin repeat-containing domain protein [Aspergillus varians]